MAAVGKIVEKDGRRLYLLKKKVIARGREDSYRVTGNKGSGGFGAIYTARRRSDNRLVVLKMSTDVSRKKNQPGGERIRREAWVMRECGKIHPELIPRVLDEGRIGGRPFFVMENPAAPYNLSVSFAVDVMTVEVERYMTVFFYRQQLVHFPVRTHGNDCFGVIVCFSHCV